MNAAKSETRAVKPDPAVAPHYVFHTSFRNRSAERTFDPLAGPTSENERSMGYLPDEETRDVVRRMHYAAYRADRSRTPAERRKWKEAYFAQRDRVVLGNRKLVFRAIRKCSLVNQMADDLIGECDIIMIRAVAAYNPWLGIRFSTYAFTCLMRGLARMSRRVAAKRMLNFMPLDAAEEQALEDVTAPVSEGRPLDEFFRSDNPLLSPREKLVLRRRFGLGRESSRVTLETLGADLGLSKERVRQVQTSAIEKLREVLGGDE